MEFNPFRMWGSLARSGSPAAGGQDQASPMRRKSQRKPSVLLVDVVKLSTAEAFATRLSDLSEHGCNLYVAGECVRAGQFLLIRQGEALSVTGIVRWVRSGHAGIEFLHPLPSALIGQLSRTE